MDDSLLINLGLRGFHKAGVMPGCTFRDQGAVNHSSSTG
jgi:hypothetical protein